MVKRIKNRLIYLTILIIITLVRFLPRVRALSLGALLGRIGYWALPREGEKVYRALRAVFDREKTEEKIRELERQVFVDLGVNAIDALRLAKISQDDLKSICVSEGLENFDRALALGRGVVAISAHVGCWEVLAAYVVLNGYPLNVVGKPLYDPRLDRLLVESREKTGVKNIARGRSTRDILRALRNNEIVGFLIDQDTKVDGCFVEFFGKPAYTATGPIALALKTRAAVMPILTYRDSRNIHHAVGGELIDLVRTGDIEEDKKINTQKCTKILEDFIRSHPSQWVWMHERWKTKKAVISDK